MPSAEILVVLADEVAEAEALIRESLEQIAAAADDEAYSEAVEPYVDQVGRLFATSEALGLDGLRRVCVFVQDNLAALAPGKLTPQSRALFERWPQLVRGYLRAPRDGVYSRELIELFRREEWPKPLDEAAGAELEEALLAIDEGDDGQEPVNERQREARPEDVLLEIPDDVDRRLVDAFLTEGPHQAAEYGQLIQRITQGEGWLDELNECRRLIHALKGSANTVGVRGVATLCHHVEDILEYLAMNSLLPQGGLAAVLVKVADTIEAMFEALLGTGDAPSDAQSVLQNVLDVVNRFDRGEFEAASEEAIPVPAAPAAEEGTAEESAAPAAPKPAQQVQPKVRIDVRVIDNLLRASGEMTIGAGHVQERVQQAMKLLVELRERHAALWDRSNEMESFLTTQGIAAGRRQALAAAAGNATPGFDPLELDQYNELHTYVQGLTETIADIQLLARRVTDALNEVDTAVNQQKLVNDELHDMLITSRMSPAATLEARLQRTVRQAAEQCHKRVTLRVDGGDVMLDDHMINTLIDPLQHLLRNAVDHGIEPPEIRVQADKPEAGEIVLRFARDGKYLVVTCSDDGAGLDLDRIRIHAIERGLVESDAQLSQDEIARLILRSGFSTATTVTQVSGRGVGMDIVHSQVARLKGSIDIRTEAGKGATFTLRLPLSLGISHCLLVSVGGETFALSSDELEQIVYEGAQYVRAEGERWSYDDGTIACPAHFLARLTGSAGAASDSERPRHVLLMKEDVGRTAIVVDSVTGGQDLVVMKAGRYLSHVRGLIGASILGDGSVVPMLELAQLLNINYGNATESAAAAADASHVPDVLVVDDSLSVRTALTLLLEEQGFRVRTAKDGVDAIEAITQRRPAVVLADLEMPRMNGLELTAHIRGQPATRNLPIIMITSRTTEKHRRQARAVGVDDYLTKPYRENDLLSRLRTILSKAA